MKNIFKIHPLYYFVSILTIITGNFKDLILVTLIILIHEVGHITAAIYYNWKIEKIVVLPYGGITIFHEYLNRPIKEEFIISIMGPIYQTFFSIIIFIFHLQTERFVIYHYAILFFNLLPIFPLDGSKILGLFFQKYFPYRISNYIIFGISIILLILLFIYLFLTKNILMIIVLFFLLFQLIKYIKKEKYIFYKFLLERYLYLFPFTKNKIISGLNINKMIRDRKHLFFYNNHYLTEKEVLKIIFDNDNQKKL